MILPCCIPSSNNLAIVISTWLDCCLCIINFNHSIHQALISRHLVGQSIKSQSLSSSLLASPLQHPSRFATSIAPIWQLRSFLIYRHPLGPFPTFPAALLATFLSHSCDFDCYSPAPCFQPQSPFHLPLAFRHWSWLSFLKLARFRLPRLRHFLHLACAYPWHPSRILCDFDCFSSTNIDLATCLPCFVLSTNSFSSGLALSWPQCSTQQSDSITLKLSTYRVLPCATLLAPRQKRSYIVYLVYHFPTLSIGFTSHID